MQQALALDGHCSGPLFAPYRRQPRVRGSGGKEIWAKWCAAEVPWTNRREIAVYWARSRDMTRQTGVQHSVDHIVPLKHPMVCGLHVQTNLRVLPLLDNIRKSNNHWPDMWAPQGELF